MSVNNATTQNEKLKIDRATLISMDMATINTLLKENDIEEADLQHCERSILSLEESEMETVASRAKKRNRDDDDNDEEWTTVTGKGKKSRQHDEDCDLEKNILLYISSKDKIPKQFALAKLFKANAITGLNTIKYLNPYKIRVQCEDESVFEKIRGCKTFTDMGWMFQEPAVVNYSYGIIKDVDLELSKDEIEENISCVEPAELISVMRLNRRERDGGWSPCESIRLCFKGSSRPPYIYVHGVRIKVEPFIFQVTQCSQCWKMGHTRKVCPHKKPTCPKCGGSHENCETKHYRCVNCSGSHMAMVKSCPAYLKEKKIREIMAEFNCTYVRATTMYVRPTPVKIREEKPIEDLHTNLPRSSHFPSYAEVVKTTAEVHNGNIPDISTPRPQKRPKRRSKLRDYTSEWEQMSDESYSQVTVEGRKNKVEKTNSKRERIQFSELLLRLKEIIFLQSDSVSMKVKNTIKLCVEWLILVAVDNIADWPLLKLILDLFNG